MSITPYKSGEEKLNTPPPPTEDQKVWEGGNGYKTTLKPYDMNALSNMHALCQ